MSLATLIEPQKHCKKDKVFTFRDPSLSMLSADWEPQPMTADQSYVLLKGPDRKNLADILKDPSIPVLVVSAKLWREIRYVVEKNPNHECAMFLCLKRLDENRPHFLAFAMFMPGQDVSGGSVSLDGPDCDKYFAALGSVPYFKENGLHRHLCHLHSHGRNGVFWSGTDDKQQLTREDLGFMDDFRFYVVVNAAGELKASFVSYSPVLQRIDAAVVLSFTEQEFIEPLTRARKKELDALLEDVLVGMTTYANLDRLGHAEWGTALGSDFGFFPNDYRQNRYANSGMPAAKSIMRSEGSTSVQPHPAAPKTPGTGNTARRAAALRRLVFLLGIADTTADAVEDTLGEHADREVFAWEIEVTNKRDLSDKVLAFMVEILDQVSRTADALEGFDEVEADLGTYVWHLLGTLETGCTDYKNSVAAVCKPSEATLTFLSELPVKLEELTAEHIVNLQDHIAEDLKDFFFLSEVY